MRHFVRAGLCIAVLWGLLGTLAGAQEAAEPWPAPPPLSGANLEKLLTPPRHFGVFVQGQKVGVLRVSLGRAGASELAITTHTAFTVSAMGVRQSLDSEETRVYSRQDGGLLRLTYFSQGNTGQSTLSGEFLKGALHIHLLQGGQRYERELPPYRESLSDAFPAEALILAGLAKPGARCRSRSFDPALQQFVNTRTEVGKTQASPELLEITGLVEEFKLPLWGRYTLSGELLESSLSGFMTLKAETQKDGAAALGTSDLVSQMSIKPPQAIKDGSTATWLTLTVAGVPENLRLNDTRQTFTPLDATRQTLRVRRETLDPARTPPLAAIDAKAFAAELQDEPRFGLKDPGIASTAKALLSGQKTSGALAQRLNDWVYETLKKEYSPAVSTAPDVLKTKSGDCGEHAVLLVALARAAGLPAREVVGLVYGESLGAFAYHAWAEVWLGRWVALDPTFGQFPADPTHLAFAKGSLMAQTAVMGLVGKLRIEAAESGR